MEMDNMKKEDGRIHPLHIIASLLCIILAIIVGYSIIDMTTENYGTITIADITDWSKYGGDALVKDTEGRIWVLYYQDRFERDDCAIGQTLDIQWRGLNPEPRGYEKATVLRVVG